MGKSKPTKWFKAVKKAFRSPSKERPSSPDHQDTKVDGDEKLLSKQHEHSPVRHPEPTPHPLPSFEIITYDEAEPEHSSRGQPFPQPLPTPEAVDPAIAAAAPSEKVLEDLIKEDGTRNNDVEALVMEKQQQDDDDDSISEEEEAAARIQQRFSEPLALKGLVRFQALVRGHQVRRQAATTLTTMEAIVRVQAVFRGRRVRVSKDGRAVRSRISKRRRLSSRAGHNGDASRGGYQFNASQIIRGEQEEYKHKRPTAYLLTQQLKRSAPKRSTLFIDCDPNQPHWGWAWLELWSNARPWEIRYVADSKGSKGSTNSKDFIEIIPSRKNSEYTTKEVDVNTLKVKYYEDYVSNPTPAAKSRSSNPMSEKKEPSGKSSAGPTYEKKEPAVKSSSPMQQHEKKEPAVKSSSPMQQHEKKEHAVKSSSPMQQHEKKEPVVKSSSPMLEKKEPIVKSSSPMFEKKEPFKSSTEKKEPTVKSTSSPKEPVNRSSSPMSEKKEPARSSEKKEPFRSARHLPEKKEFVRSSSSPLSEKKESIRSSWTSPLSEKKEPLRSPTSSSFSEKKEPLRSPPSPFSEKKEPLRSPSSPFSEQKELARSPSSPLSEKTEPEWPQMLSPVPTPTPPPETLPPHSHRVLPKPPPIEVPTLPATDLEEDSRPVQILDPKSPKSMPSSPAASDNSLPVPPSPLASDASLPVPETPPGLDSAGDDPSVTMEHLALPEAHSTNGGETNGTLNGETHSRSCSLSNVSNGEHQPGDDTPSAKGSTSEVANGHFSNGHQENGGSKSPKVDEAGENGDSPVPSKRPTCRYMVPTESAKAKFRSSSNPKTRAPDAPDSPVRTTTKRYSIGGSPTVSKGTDSPKTAFGTRKSHSFQNRATPNPKAGTPKEKPRSVETGAESPARRNSLGGDKRWRT